MKAQFEKIPSSDESSIRAFVFNKSEFDAHWHFHPEYELTLIVEGSGIRYVGNHVEDFDPGDLVLIGSNLPHSWKTVDEHDGIASAIVVQWTPSIFKEIPEMASIHELTAKAGRGLKFSQRTSKSLAHKIRMFPELKPLKCYVHLLELLEELSHEQARVLAGPSYAFDLSLQTEDRPNKVQLFVKDHFDKKIKLTDVADHVNMTEQTFSRFFSKTMQRSFFVFLNEYRVNRASRLLLETDLQVAEVGFKCGYDTLPFFYKQFRKFKQTSPLGFRKLYRDQLT